MRAGTRAAVAALLLVCSAASADYQFSGAVEVRELQKRTLTDIAHTDGSLVAVGERGLVIVSRDGGQSWTQASVPVSATLTAVDFATDDRGWAVGHAGTILHSSDGGDTWQLQFDGNEANRQWLAHTTAKKESLQSQVDELTANGDPEGLLADLEFDLEDAIFNEEDAQAALDAGPADPLLDVRFTSADEGWAVGAYGMVYHTTDGGANWRLRSGDIDNPDRYHYYSVAEDPRGNLYLSGEAGLLFHSHDGGASWTKNEDVYVGSLFGLAVRDGSIYSFGLRGNIFRSDDAGVSWSPVSNPTSFSLYGGGTLNDGTVALVGAGGGVLRIAADGSLSTSIQDSRATLSGIIDDGDSVLLVGMEGLERLESSNE